MKLSLRSTMVATMAGLLAITTAGMFAVSLFSTRTVLNSEVSDLVTNEATRAAEATRAFLRPAEQAASITAGQVASNIDDIDDHFEDHLLTTLNVIPELDGIFVGESDGSFLFVSRDSSKSLGGTRTKKISVTADGPVTTLTWRDDVGTVVAVEPDPDDTYDPRTRPWYEAVDSKTTVAWTDPYIFFTSQQPGVTASSPVVIDGDVVAVVGVDVQLSGLDDFLRSLSTSANTSAALMNDDQIIALLNGEAVTNAGEDSLRYRTIDDLTGTTLATAFAALGGSADLDIDATSASRVRNETFEVNGQPSHVAFASLPNTELPWYVVVAAPESDFLTELQQSRQTTLLVVAIAGILSIIVAAWFAQAVSKPMTELRRSARELRSGEVGEPVDSRFVEIAETADALYTAHTELEGRVNERTEALQVEVAERRDAELRAVAASKSKSEFLANISHELRTPLTAVIGYSSILGMTADDISPDEVKENASVIEDAGSHLLALINDILDLAKIEAGESTLEESAIDLCQLVEEIDRLLRNRAEGAGVQLLAVCDETNLLFADRRRVKQILLNLGSNAVKFSEAGDSVTIRAEVVDELVQIEVTDTGIGMTEQELETAMEMFGQVGHEVAKSEGTGIGLPLTQRLVNEHQGTLHIESTPNEGTHVTVTFPANRTVRTKVR